MAKCEVCDSIVGHGLEAHDKLYCCANCARHAGEKGLVDHA